MEIRCVICSAKLEDTWVQIIVRDKMGEDYVHEVGFVDSTECLIKYTERVARDNK